MYIHFFKRSIDFILSLAGIIILAIPMVIVAVIIKIDSPGAVFFRQKRIGKNKSEFYILKFRSMRADTPGNVPTHKLGNANGYITKTGAFIRKYSIDEIPQLFNILKGDMAVIGPRPALWNQYDLVAERDKYGANGVRPGLTGWAQINGRDELPIEEKARFDGEYVEKMSFLFDVRCFFGTIFSVLRHDGVVEGAAEQKLPQKEEAVQ